MKLILVISLLLSYPAFASTVDLLRPIVDEINEYTFSGEASLLRKRQPNHLIHVNNLLNLILYEHKVKIGRNCNYEHNFLKNLRILSANTGLLLSQNLIILKKQGMLTGIFSVICQEPAGEVYLIYTGDGYLLQLVFL